MLLDPLQARALFGHALENRYALLAVNADSPAAIVDTLEAARAADSPVAIEASLWQLTGRSFGNGDPRLGLARYLTEVAALARAERYAHLPVLFHTDHIQGPQTREILTAAIQGVSPLSGRPDDALFASTLSLDSADLSEEENIAMARRLAEIARAAGRPLTLEMEAGVDDGLTPEEVTERLLGAVEATEAGTVWLWAPGLGTRHGFSEEGFPAFSADAVARQRETAQRVTGRPVGIALHGSSGLEPSALADAVAAGVVKVNWSSESLLLRSQAAREYYARFGARLEAGASGFKDAAMDHGVQSYVAGRYVPRVQERIERLGAAGRAAPLRKALRV